MEDSRLVERATSALSSSVFYIVYVPLLHYTSESDGNTIQWQATTAQTDVVGSENACGNVSDCIGDGGSPEHDLSDANFRNQRNSDPKPRTRTFAG